MKASHLNTAKRLAPSKSVPRAEPKQAEVVDEIVGEPKPAPVKNDGKKHIKWAEDLKEVKKFTKSVTKQRIAEVREKAKNTLVNCGKSILMKKLSDYPEDFIDTAPSTPTNQGKFGKAPFSAKQTHKKKFTQAKSVVPIRPMSSVLKSKFENEFLSKMQKRYGLLSKIAIY